jgi:SAM-dependent methyltransferase
VTEAEVEARTPLRALVPERSPADLLLRNGYALQSHLVDDSFRAVAAGLERFQATFLARTRELWTPDFPIPGDALAHFTRQWEYPYAWANLGRPGEGPVLDAGSGLTFLPFLLAAAGYDVYCCDADDGLGLVDRYERACADTGVAIAFSSASLTDLPYADGSFGTVLCISVLEHVGAALPDVVRSLARLVAPGGRLVLTLDVSLRRDGPVLVEDVGVLLDLLEADFRPTHPVDLGRAPDLLTSDACLATSSWRLPWPWLAAVDGEQVRGPHVATRLFRSLAVLGLTFDRRPV